MKNTIVGIDRKKISLFSLKVNHAVGYLSYGKVKTLNYHLVFVVMALCLGY